MTDNSIITSILANGGWCQLYYSNQVALINVASGRLFFYNEELSFVEKFDLHTDTLNGFYVIFNRTKQRLEKANWIKKILTIGGKTIHDCRLPEALHGETVEDFLSKLKSSKEIYNLRLIDKEVTGRTLEFSGSDLTVEVFPSNKTSETMKIHFTDIVCFEFRTQKLKQFVRT